MYDYNDYLKICDEIKLIKIGPIIEVTMMFNEWQMNKYNEEICCEKVSELESLLFDVMYLEAESAFHNNREVYERCQIYYTDIIHQMNRLLDKCE